MRTWQTETQFPGYDQWGNMWLSPTGTGPVISTSTPTTNVYMLPNGTTPNNQDSRLSFDPAGNLQTLNSMTTAAAYNAENQLTALNTNPGAAATLAYDSLGNRVQQSVSGKWPVRYVYDAFGLASVYVNGAWSKDYIADGSGKSIATENASGSPCTTCYYGFDHLGSVRLVMDQNATVVSRRDYLPFGEEVFAGIGGRDAHFGSTADVTEKFTGQIRDQDSGVDYFNARYLNLPLGRFNSPDPGNVGANLLSSQSWNGYGYVLGHPLVLTDPTGKDTGTSTNYAGLATGICPPSQATCPTPSNSLFSNAFWGAVLPSIAPNDASLGLDRYLNYVRYGGYTCGFSCGWGWVASDDPLAIMAFMKVNSASADVPGAAVAAQWLLNNAACGGIFGAWMSRRLRWTLATSLVVIISIVVLKKLIDWKPSLAFGRIGASDAPPTRIAKAAGGAARCGSGARRAERCHHKWRTVTYARFLRDPPGDPRQRL